jgi:hypothetical protein
MSMVTEGGEITGTKGQGLQDHLVCGIASATRCASRPTWPMPSARVTASWPSSSGGPRASGKGSEQGKELLAKRLAR